MAAMPAADNGGEGVMATALNFVKECGESDLSLCIKVSSMQKGGFVLHDRFFFSNKFLNSLSIYVKLSKILYRIR